LSFTVSRKRKSRIKKKRRKNNKTKTQTPTKCHWQQTIKAAGKKMGKVAQSATLVVAGTTCPSGQRVSSVAATAGSSSVLYKIARTFSFEKSAATSS